MSFSIFNPFASAAAPPPAIKFLSADEAKAIDAELMGPEGAFSLDQVRSFLPFPTLSSRPSSNQPTRGSKDLH